MRFSNRWGTAEARAHPSAVDRTADSVLTGGSASTRSRKRLHEPGGRHNGRPPCRPSEGCPISISAAAAELAHTLPLNRL